MKKILFITSILLITCSIHATTIIVNNTNDSGAGSLRQASIDAGSGDTIRFNPNLLTAAVDFISLTSGEISFGNKAIVIKGLYTAGDTLFISGNNNSRIFSFNGAGKVVLDSLVLINGNANGIGNENGGAVSYTVGSDTLHIVNSILRDNTAEESGGAIYSDSPYSSIITITNSTITGNRAENSNGGAICSSTSYAATPTYSSVIVTNSSISDNSSNSNGGAIYSYVIYATNSSSSLVVVNNSDISRNTSDNQLGGGIYSFSQSNSSSATSKVEVMNSTISDNNAFYGVGGGIFSTSDSNSGADSSIVTVANSMISGNTTYSAGGAIFSSSSSLIASSSPSFSIVEVTNSTISDNTVDGNGGDGGGGLYSYAKHSLVSLFNSTISGNTTSTGDGGGIYSYSTANNSSDSSHVVVSSSTINGNSAFAGNGGGIYSNGFYSVVKLTKSTLTGNTASDNGGGVYSIANNSMACLTIIGILNSTITGNTASNYGAGIYHEGPLYDLYSSSSIIAENGPGGTGVYYPGFPSNIINSYGFNIFSDTPYGTVGSDQLNVTAVSLNLLPLAFYGGVTETMLPGIGSVAINLGDPTDMSDAQNRAVSEGIRDVGASETVCYTPSGVYNETLCFGESIIVNGTVYDANNLTGTEVFTNIGANNCDSIVAVSLTILSAIDNATTTSGINISANNGNATYQWLDCNNNYSVINGETNSGYTPTSNGNYAVELTEDGCADTSACVAITTLGIIENSFGNALTVYPNPTSGNFSVDLGAVYESTDVSIMDISGKLIYSKTMQQSKILNLSIEEPIGVYFVSIKAANRQAIIRLVKE